MNLRKTLLAILALTLTLSVAGDALADISNAAVLFLRIAPGSRAAGMGEAYVAVADDATATHWNPAGLGSYPLSDTWIESEIPAAYRPITGFAPMSTGGTGNYLDYDIWAITPAGLMRYDNKRWHTDEVFSTRTDETLEQKVRNYFNVADDEWLAAMVARVAEKNNRGSYEELTALRDEVLAAVPESYDQYEAMTQDFDSLLVCYGLARVNWDRVKEMRERFADGMKDSSLTDTECDRVSVALERSKNRFLPEELHIPFSALFESAPTAIASTGEVLLVGSAGALARYNGTNWQIVQMEDGSTLDEIIALHVVGGSILVATESGISVFNGLNATPLTSADGSLPEGKFEAVGGNVMTDLYAVVDGRLYRYNGTSWTTSTSHTVAIDDSMDKIAADHSIYGGAVDKQRFIDQYRELHDQRASVEPVGADEIVEPVETAEESGEPVPADSTAVEETPESPEAETVEPMAADAEAAPEPLPVAVPGIDAPLNPGDEIVVPMVAGIKGRVNTIHVDLKGWIWLGTDHGVFYFDGHSWTSPGYENHVVVEGETLDSLAGTRSDLSEEQRQAYRTLLVEINDLDDAELAAGTSIKIYANPAASSVNSIASHSKTVFFATDNGLIEYDGRNWSRSSLRGLTRSNIVGVSTLGAESWIASDQKLIIKGRGHSEISVMHVNWLPELADDLYYEFLSVVSNKEGWGTFGGSITFISYGKFLRTGENNEQLGEFESFDVAASLSYGSSLTSKLKGGVSLKVIYSRLADQGAGKEQGQGKATGFGVDLGLLYHWSQRLTLGMALTNLGPELSYIDAAQSDPLPLNLALGFSYKLMQSDYTRFLITAEINKLMVGLDDGSSDELKQTVINGGAEFTYADLISARAGYIYDQEGDIKTPTIGFGLSPFTWGEFDFAYIPSQDDFSLANTLRISLRIII